MVKSILGDETQFKSIEDRLFNLNLPSEVGLVIGKLNPTLDRGFIFDLIPTPPNDNGEPVSSLSTNKLDKKKPQKSKSQTDSSSSLLLDTDWISEHARQVSQMLLGGMGVIGIYFWSPESSFNSSTPTLLQVIKGVADATPASSISESIVVHICYSPRKLMVRSCLLSSSSLRICDFKLGRVLGSLRSFKCLYNFEMQLPISKEGNFRDIIREAISRHGKELRGAKAIVDGNLVVDDQLLVSDGSHNIELLLPVTKDYVGEGKEEVIGIVVFRGFICSYSYLNPKETIFQAISDIKGDISMSLQSRLNIICDEAEEGLESVGEKEESVEGLTERSMTQLGLQFLKKPTSLSFPRKVLVPWIGDTFVCDYLQQSETFDVVKDHCKELLSLEAPADTSLILEPEKEAVSLAMKSFWDVVVPRDSVSGSNSKSIVNTEKDSVHNKGSKTVVKSATFSIVTAIAILLLAIVIGFLFYSS